tara:strand:+ start:21939 stop:22361 length:423 start_codon:yes stop_codon:yes gene_type:complete
MAVVYPGLVNIDNSQIEVNTVNVYDDNQRTHTYDLSDQFPAWDGTLLNSDSSIPTGQELIELQTALKDITLPSPARVNTLMIILDGLTLSPNLNPADPNSKGDYKVIDSTKVELMWRLEDLPRRHSDIDTPVLLARYTLA